MTIRQTISNFISHFSPLLLVKQVFPAHKSSQAFSHYSPENKPWMNVDDIKLTADDFA